MMLSNSQLPETRADRPAGDGSKSTEPSATRTRQEPAHAAAAPTATSAATLTSATAIRECIARSDASPFVTAGMEGSTKLLPLTTAFIAPVWAQDNRLSNAPCHRRRIVACWPQIVLTMAAAAH